MSLSDLWFSNILPHQIYFWLSHPQPSQHKISTQKLGKEKIVKLYSMFLPEHIFRTDQTLTMGLELLTDSPLSSHCGKQSHGDCDHLEESFLLLEGGKKKREI